MSKSQITFLFWFFFVVTVSGQQLTTSHVKNEVIAVDNINELRNLKGITSATVYVSGYYLPGDGGGGYFHWNEKSVQKDDNGLTIKLNTLSVGRFIRSTNKSYINPMWFGAKGDGIANDTKALQTAINFASKKQLNFESSKVFYSKVHLPSKHFLVDSLLLFRGVILEGSGQFSTVILHTGKSKKCIYTNTNTPNRWVAISNLTIRGKGLLGSVGIYLFEANFASYIDRVTISNFYDNIFLDNCWTIRVTNSHIYNALRYNIFGKNLTSALIEANRIDRAGEDNIFIDKGDKHKTVGLVISKNAIQQANVLAP